MARRTQPDATARIPPAKKQRVLVRMEGAAPSAPVIIWIAETLASGRQIHPDVLS